MTLRIACVAIASALGCKQSASPPTASATGSAPPLEPTPSLIAFEPAKSTLDPNLVELGRLLFFDTRLSRDNNMSCATCHEPKTGWSDGLATALGLHGKQLPRNTPTVVNIDQRLPLFWDGRAKTAEEQVLMPVTNPDEMAQDADQLVTVELAQIPEYAARFHNLFPGAGMTQDTVAKAIATFERSLISYDAPLDRYLHGDHAAMSNEAVAGMNLFVGKAGCIKCHDGPQLTDNSFHNIGVTGEDEGRFKVLELPAMKRAFKTPGLRDVALTAPYFHDGSKRTLEEVIDHYDRGGDIKDNLDRDIKPLHLTADERKALVTFMNALTATRPVIVEPPRLPGSYARAVGKLTTFMKQAEKMLGVIDSLIASINDRNWSEMDERSRSLLQLAEELDASRGTKVQKAQMPQFREKQGDLVIAIKDLQGAIASRSAPATYKAYDHVRATCDGCHDVFKPDKAPVGNSN